MVAASAREYIAPPYTAPLLLLTPLPVRARPPSTPPQAPQYPWGNDGPRAPPRGKPGDDRKHRHGIPEPAKPVGLLEGSGAFRAASRPHATHPDGSAHPDGNVNGASLRGSIGWAGAGGTSGSGACWAGDGRTA